MLQTFNAKLVEKKDLTADVMHLRFEMPADGLAAVSGQYMIVMIPNGEYPYRRLYSIASDCSSLNAVDLVAKIIPGGVASEYFKKLQVGDTIEMQGPAGVFYLKNNSRDKLFLATGTGIAPIKAMVTELLCRPGPEHYDGQIRLIWGLRNYEDVYYFDEFKKLSEQYKNFRFKICLSREENLEKIPEAHKKYFSTGRITKCMEEGSEEKSIPKVEAANYSNSDVYLCGDRAVVETLRQSLYEKGFEKGRVIFEKF